MDGNPAFYVYELQHPGCSGDPDDICITSTLHAFFTIRGLGKGNFGDTEWPAPFGVYEQLEP